MSDIKAVISKMKSKRCASRPVKIVYPGDPGFDEEMAVGKIAWGGDEAWHDFIHGRVPAKPTRKPPARPKR